MEVLKSCARQIIRRLGYDIRQVPPGWNGLGRDPFGDMRRLTSSPLRPMVFDVGANVGQSIANLRRYFATPIIHAFEPCATTVAELGRSTAGIDHLFLNNVASGSRCKSRLLIEFEGHSGLNSFLEPGSDTVEPVSARRPVQVTTLDRYCAQRRIETIDILKTDTEGFDLEVLKGADGLLHRRALHQIFIEINFTQKNRGQAPLDEIYRFLIDGGFALVSFYMLCYHRDRRRYTNALFIQPDYVATGTPPHGRGGREVRP